MEWLQVFTIVAIQICISAANEILYVLPNDNSTNDSCPSQPCAKFSQYLLDNGTLSVISNVKYHFLPGEHHVPANMVLQNLHNFTIVGTISKTSLPTLLSSCSQSNIISIIKSFNVTIANVTFKQYPQLHLTNLLIDLCYSCTIQSVIFLNFGLTGNNLIGNSHLAQIMIKPENSNFSVFCKGITLMFFKYQQQPYANQQLIMDQININGEGKKCYNSDPVGINVLIVKVENFTIIIHNSFFSRLLHSALVVENRCFSKNTIIIENCTFEYNTFRSPHFQIILRPLIHIMLSQNNKIVSFKNCSFKNNYLDDYLISVYIRSQKKFK